MRALGGPQLDGAPDCFDDRRAVGYSLSAAGDLNGDGFSDVIYGSPRTQGGIIDAGMARVWFGGSDGLSFAVNLCGEAAGDRFGAAVSGIGDVDGDGYDDVAVGAPGAFGSSGFAGRVYIFRGRPFGVDSTAAWTLEGSRAAEEFGAALTGLGDSNGDGFADFAVGAPAASGRGMAGIARVYLGGLSGPAATPAWSYGPIDVEDALGISISGNGDVNGDGHADLLIGAPGWEASEVPSGRALLFLGASQGFEPDPLSISPPDLSGDIEVVVRRFGSAVAIVGDCDGDQLADLAIGAPETASSPVLPGKGVYGAVALLAGSRDGAPSVVLDHILGAADWNPLGHSVSGAGDVDGDGLADWIAGGPPVAGGSGGGIVFVSRGFRRSSPAPARYPATGFSVTSTAGFSVAGLGDIDGDGLADVGWGDPGYSNATTMVGAWYWLRGYVRAAGEDLLVSLVPPLHDAAEYAGASIADAGDVNGDGRTEFIVGSPHYGPNATRVGRARLWSVSVGPFKLTTGWECVGDQLDERLGSAVAPAGDVNGDGYADVVIGSPLFDGSQSDVGRVTFYYGSAQGLPQQASATRRGLSAGGMFGSSVASAGDVNGDGFSDVIVGEPYGRSSLGVVTGSAQVYLGSQSGIARLPAWTASGIELDELFGASVATAGDFNGDGYDDVLVGSPMAGTLAPQEGAVSLFLGGPTGLATAPAARWISGSTGSWFGYPVVGGGDFDGDSFSDFLVGSYRHTSVYPREGRVDMFLGGASDPGQSASRWHWEGFDTDHNFGAAIALLGDGDLDGRTDFVVDGNGDYEFSAVVFPRSPVAYSTLRPTWLEDQTYSEGWSLGASDVDGDGRSDFLLGAPFLYANGAGSFKCMPVGGSNAPPRAVRQWRTLDARPLAPSSGLGPLEPIVLTHSARNAMGRGAIWAEFEQRNLDTEVAPVRIATGISEPALAPDSLSADPRITVLSPQHDSPGRYAWKARLRSRHPLFPRTPWFLPLGVGPGQTAFRVVAPASAVDVRSLPTPALEIASVTPHPLAGTGVLRFVTPKPGHVALTLHDVTGRRRSEIFAGWVDAGPHEVRLAPRGSNGAGLPAGAYFVRLSIGGAEATRKIVLL